MKIKELVCAARGQLTAKENTFAEFAAWIARNDDVYHFGTSQAAVTRALLDLRARQADLGVDCEVAFGAAVAVAPAREPVSTQDTEPAKASAPLFVEAGAPRSPSV